MSSRGTELTGSVGDPFLISGIAAALVVNAVLITYIVMAWGEDGDEQTKEPLTNEHRAARRNLKSE